jgi:hypothetical protein
MPISTIEQRTGKLYGGLWSQYDDDLFIKSLELFKEDAIRWPWRAWARSRWWAWT